MPLHKRHTLEYKHEDDVFASSVLARPGENSRFPADEADPGNVWQLVHDELMIDGNARLNLATFCSTYADEYVRRLMNESISKNMIDKDEYPQTAELEMRCVHMLADLWHAPRNTTAAGCSTTGSSEAAMLGALAMKRRWQQQCKKEKRSCAHPNLVTGPVQICWHKFARYFDVELRVIPMREGKYCTVAEEVAKYCDENTIGVVATLGTTFTLQYEPVLAIAEALDILQEETGWDIPIHVDGASGGFLAPFIQKDLIWDFRIERVKSINSSGHKFGLAPLGVGWVLWRSEEYLPEELIFNVNYLGGNMPTFALNFSRPGGQIICQYYNFLRLGHEGYFKVQRACADAALFFAERLKKYGIFEIISDGDQGVPGVCWKLREPEKHPFTLYDLAEKLRYTGWLVPAYSLPADCENIVIQRILVRHGVTVDLLDKLDKDIARALQSLDGKSCPVGANTAFHH